MVISPEMKSTSNTKHNFTSYLFLKLRYSYTMSLLPVCPPSPSHVLTSAVPLRLMASFPLFSIATNVFSLVISVTCP